MHPVATFETARRLALELPEVTAESWWGTPGFKVARKGFARLREEGVLMVRIDEADKRFLIETRPHVYFTIPHYDGYPAVLVRLGAIKPAELGRLLSAAWRFVAPA